MIRWNTTLRVRRIPETLNPRARNCEETQKGLTTAHNPAWYKFLIKMVYLILMPVPCHPEHPSTNPPAPVLFPQSLRYSKPPHTHQHTHTHTHTRSYTHRYTHTHVHTHIDTHTHTHTHTRSIHTMIYTHT